MRRATARRLVCLTLLAVSAALPSTAAALPAGSTFLVSRPDGVGSLAPLVDNAATGPFAVSADGRYVAFASHGDGVAPGANGRFANLFLRDTLTNETTLVSRSDGFGGVAANAQPESVLFKGVSVAIQPGATMPDGPTDQPHVLVAFSTKATNLVDHVEGAVPATGGLEQVWLRDVTAGTTVLVSRRSQGPGAPPATAAASAPSIAAGPQGPLVAFHSAGLGNGGLNVYLREVNRRVTHLVSCGGGTKANCTAPTPNVAPNSRNASLQFVDGAAGTLCPAGQRCALVAFETDEPTLIGAAVPASQIVVARALQEGGGLADPDLWRLASARHLTTNVAANDTARQPSLAPDGRAVAFVTTALNLAIGAPVHPNNTAQGYIRDLQFNGTTLATVGKLPSGQLEASSASVLDVSLGGGVVNRRLGFTSAARNFGVPNLGLLDRAWVVTPFANEGAKLLDRGSGGGGPNGDQRSLAPQISGDGASAVFLSFSTNLGLPGSAEFARVHRRRIAAGPGFDTLEMISRPSGTGPFAHGTFQALTSPSAISADGRYVAFQSSAALFGGLRDVEKVFVRDTVAGTTTLVSRGSDSNGGVVATQNSQLVGISDDGRRVLFNTDGRSFGDPQDSHAYVRDLDAGTTTAVDRINGPAGRIVGGTGLSISGDGNRVAFSTIELLDPDAEPGDTHLYVRDLTERTTTFVDRDDGERGDSATARPQGAALDRDGSRVAWSTEARLAGAAAQPQAVVLTRVYRRDLATNRTVLVSRQRGDGLEVNADAINPAINASGDVVAFESAATNLDPPVAASSIWVRTIPTGQLQLASRQSGANGQPADDRSSGPSLDASGTRVAFTSGAGNLGALTFGFDNRSSYVRDLAAQTTELVSRADGLGGGPADPPNIDATSLSANGNCVAFSGRGSNHADGFASADFQVVRERALRGDCGPPLPAPGPPAPPGPGPGPGPGPPPGPGPGPGPAATPAVLSRLSLKPARFQIGGRKGGTKVLFQLDKASAVTLRFDRLLAGRKQGKRCSTKARKGRRCEVAKLTGQLALAASRTRSGANTVTFSGKLGRKTLAPGRYRLTATPLKGKARTVTLIVVKRPARR